MKYHTTHAQLVGAICGHLWMPDTMAGIPHACDLLERRRSDFRAILAHELKRYGGDFQDARFTEDTELTITRRAEVRPGIYLTHTRTLTLSTLKNCADLFADGYFSFDFN